MKLGKYIYACMAVLLLCTACEKNEVLLTLNQNILQLSVGETALLEAEVVGSSAAITWTSSAPEVVSVMLGVLTAHSEGQAIVTAEVEGAKAACTIFVTEGGTVSLNQIMAQLEVKQTLQLEATVSGTSKQPVWSSDNAGIATVDPSGLVTALTDGQTHIWATVGAQKASCLLTVIQQGGSYHGEYQLVWEENFDGETLNLDDWNIEVNGGGGGNNESQYYTDRPENLRLEDGNLVIEARMEPYEGKQYTSARINTKGKHEFAYCKAEARIWLPSGRGTWPAFWMLGTRGSWPTCGEIDIMEHIGSDPTMISHALHTRAKNGTRGNNWNQRVTVDGVEGEYHVYGMEWLEYYQFGRDAIRFYIDDQVSTIQLEPTNERDIEQWPFYNQSGFDNKFFIILNMALGGSMGGSINTDIFANPVLMKVDWVRVYQKPY